MTTIAASLSYSDIGDSSEEQDLSDLISDYVIQSGAGDNTKVSPWESRSSQIRSYVTNESSIDVTNESSIDSTVSKYVSVFTSHYIEHFEKIDKIARHAKDLFVSSGEEGDLPKEHTINWARVILQQLIKDEFVPTTIVASAEGGIAVCFVAGDRYADIECLNSGEILGVLSNKNDRPLVWEIEPSEGSVARATSRISEFIEKPKTQKNDSRRAWK